MKKIFKKMSKTLMAITLSIATALSSFAPIIKVYAIENSGTYAEIQLGRATGINNSTKEITYEHGTVTVGDNEAVLEENGGNYFLYTRLDGALEFNFDTDYGYTAYSRLNGAQNPDEVGCDELLGCAYAFEFTIGQHYNLDFEFELANNAYTVNFGNASWTVGEDEVTASITGKTINNGALILLDDEEINLTGFDSETMQVKVSSTGGFQGYLSVSEGKTTLSTLQDGSFPSEETLTFTVEEKSNNNNPEPTGSYTVDFGTASWNVGGENVTATVVGKDLTNGAVSISGTEKITLTGFNGETMQVKVASTDGFNTVLNVNENNEVYIVNPSGGGIPSEITFTVEEKSNNNNPEPQQGNTNATINVITGIGTYEYVDGNNVTRTENYTGAFTEDPEKVDGVANIAINGSMSNPENGEVSYNSNEEDTTVTFSFISFWHMRYYDEIVINDGTNEHTYNVSDYIDFTDRTDVLNHLDGGGQMISFDIPDVPKADSYDVTVKIGRASEVYVGNFLWTADPEQADSENYIGHSKLEIVKAEYTVDGTKYTITEDEIKANQDYDGHRFNSFVSPDGYLNYGVEANVDYDDGSMVLPAGALVTMRVVPEYGYQVTSVNNGGEFTTTDDGVSEFTVEVQPGAAYFRATVEAVNDEVVSNTKKVSSGTVEIADDEIDAGTVRLSVDDVELSKEKITDFESYASEKGNYEISQYLDINLNQVFYQGTADKVWSNQIHHLDKEALITLKLADGVDVSNLVIVHNIDDGDQFEIIEIESYDAKTNTITFKTKSFSNYAIATKTEVVDNTTKESDNTSTSTTTNSTADTKKTVSSPKTSDNVTKYVYGLVLSLIGITYLVVVLKKRELVK